MDQPIHRKLQVVFQACAGRFYTDCGEPENKADNVDFVHLSFDDYKALVRERLRVAFNPPNPYKLCTSDRAWEKSTMKMSSVSDFSGYGDIDVVYGNIRSFYTEKVLARLNVLSTHTERLSGHFAVLRNTRVFRHAFERIANYRTFLEAPHYIGMDEGFAVYSSLAHNSGMLSAGCSIASILASTD